jgi:hypothetical protein
LYALWMAWKYDSGPAWIRSLVPGSWFLVPGSGPWFPGSWFPGINIELQRPGLDPVPGSWFLVPGSGPWFPGSWFLVPGSLVPGSLVLI